MATGIGAGRVAIGTVLFAAPTTATRMLGVDSASAKRMAFLARMTAARDVSLGIGTLAARGSDQLGLWLAVGALADAADAVAISTATKRGVTRGVSAAAAVLSAVAAAAVGGRAAYEIKRRRPT